MLGNFGLGIADLKKIINLQFAIMNSLVIRFIKWFVYEVAQQNVFI